MMNSHQNQISTRILFVLAGLVLSLTAAVFFKYSSQSSFAESPTSLDADGNYTSHVVTIYDDNVRVTISTKSTNVASALANAGIVLGPNDSVDPSIDTTINSRKFFINVHRAHPAVVSDGSVARRVMTSATDPREVAVQAGYVLNDKDEVDIADSPTILLLETGTTISYAINRSNLVKFSYYGQVFDRYTRAATVGDFIAEQGITLVDEDSLSLPLDAPIANHLELSLDHNRADVVDVEEEVPFATQTIYDYNHDVGYSAEVTAGVKGRKIVTYQIHITNGEILSRTALSELVTTQPVTRVVVVGARSNLTSPSENEAISWRFFRANGFTREQTAGIMGNLMQEHGFKTDGDGLAQWTGSRRARLYSLPDPLSINTQLGFLMSELNGSYWRVRDALRGTSSVEEATRIFQNQFERCGKCMESRRIGYAYEIYSRYAE